jgi:transposase
MVARFRPDGAVRPAKPKSPPRAARKSPFRGLSRMQPNAAGIDVGSAVHYVAVPEERAEESVRHFGCYTTDLQALAGWLQECGVETVAMESTGVYWVPLFQILERAGLEVKLVDARHVSNVPGKETDVDDARWLQQLHSYGLLRGCFRPPDEVAVLRSYWRQRAAHVETGARAIHLMQKALEQMNLQLHKAISDISGVTGMKILRAIVAGERDPRVLARHRDRKIKCSEAELEAALTGDWREEHLFALGQALAQYDFAHQQLAECDAQIQARLGEVASQADPASMPPYVKKKRRKNQPHFELREELYRVTGVDLCRIDGIEAMTAYTVLTESGFRIGEDFVTEKHYASWLGLCPHNRITGGKVRSRHTRKVCNRAAAALRVAAQSLERSQSALGAFYRRMKAKHGAPKAVTATAHKLACLIYRMLRFGMDYVDQGERAYAAQQDERQFRSLQRQAARRGYTLVEVPKAVVS